MLTQDGRVKVADFGIAKVGSTKMTQTGMLLDHQLHGPEHFSASRWTDVPISLLSDICLRLITGQPPFAAEEPGNASAIRSFMKTLTPIKLKPGMNPGLNALVVKALARDQPPAFRSGGDVCSWRVGHPTRRNQDRTDRTPAWSERLASARATKKRRRVGPWLLAIFAAAHGRHCRRGHCVSRRVQGDVPPHSQGKS